MESQVEPDLLELVADLMPGILSLLGPKDMCRLACVSHNLRSMAEESAFWRDLCAAEGKLFTAALTMVNENRWKDVYRTKHIVDKLESWLQQPGEGEALLLPSGQYSGLSLAPATPMVAIIGLENGLGAPVILAGSPPHNLCELTGAGLVLRNVTLRFTEVPAPTGHMRAWPAALYVGKGKLVRAQSYCAPLCISDVG